VFVLFVYLHTKIWNSLPIDIRQSSCIAFRVQKLSLPPSDITQACPDSFRTLVLYKFLIYLFIKPLSRKPYSASTVYKTLGLVGTCCHVPEVSKFAKYVIHSFPPHDVLNLVVLFQTVFACRWVLNLSAPGVALQHEWVFTI